jgi:hypothetical protein
MTLYGYQFGFMSRVIGEASPPSDGLALWLDAADDTSLITTGSNVDQWNDKSGNNLNFFTTGGAPTVDTSRFPMQTINFPNTGFPFGDFMDGTGSSNVIVSQSTPFSFYIIYAPAIGDSFSQVISQGPDNFNGWTVEYFGDARPTFTVRYTDPPPAKIQVASANTHSTADLNLFIVKQSALDSRSVQLNNGPITPDSTPYMTPPIAFNSARYLGTGRNQFGIAINVFDGNIGEVLIYSRILDSVEETQIISYLTNKWSPLML